MANAATGRENPKHGSGSSGSAQLEPASSKGSSVKASGTLSKTEEQLRTAMSEFQELQADGKGQSEEAKALLNTIKILKAQRDEQISLGRVDTANKPGP